MMNILIIGSKGFIGSHALNFFSSKENYICWGCDVVVDYVNLNYFQIDATNSNFHGVFKEIAFDICVNCSGAASVPASLQNPIHDFALNTYHVALILDAIRKYAPQCKFINLSSAAVYGNPEVLPIAEDAQLSPVSPYGIHKKMAEDLCREYHTYFNLKTVSLRIFSAYGPGLKKQLLWDISQKARQSAAIHLFGTGNETRDFIYIDDILRAAEFVINKGEFDGAVYNVASGLQTKIKDIAAALTRELSYQGQLSFRGTERAGDPLYWCADIRRISVLGFIQQVSITEGIKKYVAWLRDENLV